MVTPMAAGFPKVVPPQPVPLPGPRASLWSHEDGRPGNEDVVGEDLAGYVGELIL